jgi:sugar phosphate isomerase/epimerase
MNAGQKTYPKLSRSYKGVYPFTIGTTSFIYPDHYLPNVELLGPFLDEVELLLFESTDMDTLLAPSVIEELRLLAKKIGLSYNLHLPTDISIADPDPQRRQRATEIMVQIINRVVPLCPSTHTLHLPYTENSFAADKVRRWRDRIYTSLEKILTSGIRGDSISIETLNYPLDLVAEVVADMDLTICMDLGHLILNGDDIERGFRKYRGDIAIIHLHGIENGRDHLSLDRLSEKYLGPVLQILNQFNRSLSLEVFCFDDLAASLAFLEKRWNGIH